MLSLVNKAVEDMQTTSVVQYPVPAMENLFLKSHWPDSFFQKLNKVKYHKRKQFVYGNLSVLNVLVHYPEQCNSCNFA